MLPLLSFSLKWVCRYSSYILPRATFLVALVFSVFSHCHHCLLKRKELTSAEEDSCRTFSTRVRSSSADPYGLGWRTAGGARAVRCLRTSATSQRRRAQGFDLLEQAARGRRPGGFWSPRKEETPQPARAAPATAPSPASGERSLMPGRALPCPRCWAAPSRAGPCPSAPRVSSGAPRRGPRPPRFSWRGRPEGLALPSRPSSEKPSESVPPAACLSHAALPSSSGTRYPVSLPLF